MPKFCNNCGTELSDDTLICSNCGMNLNGSEYVMPASADPNPVIHESQAPREMSKPKKNGKWWLIPIVAVLAIAIAGAFLWKPLLLKFAPDIYLSMASGRTMDALSKRSEDSPYALLASADEIMDDGTLDVSLSYSDYYNGDIQANMSISSKKEQKQWMFDALINSSEQNVDLSMYMDADCLTLRSDPFTDGKYYGLTYDTFSDDIRKSGFNMILSEDEMQQCDEIVQMLNRNINQTVDYDQLLQPYLEIMNDYAEDLKPVIGRHSITLDNKTRKCDTIEYTIEQDQLFELLHDLLEQLEKDEAASDLVGDTAALAESLHDSLGNLEDHSDMKFVLTYYICNTHLAALETNMTFAEHEADDQVNWNFMLSLGTNPRISDIRLDMDITYGDNKISRTIISAIEQRDDLYINTFTLKTDNYGIKEKYVLTSKWNSDSGDWNFKFVSDMDDEAAFEFTAKISEYENGFEVRIDELNDLLKIPEDEMNQITSTLSIRFTKGCVIDKPEYINLDQMNLDVVRDILINFVDGEMYDVLSDTRNRLHSGELLNLTQKYELENNIEKAMKRENWDIVVHLIEDLNEETIDDAADRLAADFTPSVYYSRGVVIVMCPETKEWAIRTSGKVSNYFHSSYKEQLSIWHPDFMGDGNISVGVNQLLSLLSWV